MLTDKYIKLLKDITECVRETYSFSLIPTDKNYKPIEKIAEEMGGGILFTNGYEVKAARCGNSFIIKMPDEKDLSRRLSCFAYGLSILILGLEYQIKNESFLSKPNMVFIDNAYELLGNNQFDALMYFRHELVLPEYRLRKVVENYVNNGSFYIQDIVKELGFNYSFIETRLRQCKMIPSF